MFARAAGMAVLAAFLLAAPASAERGVAVDIGLIEVDRPLLGGGTYRLPVLGVRNPGDEVSHYRMGVGGAATAGMSVPDATWFSFTPAEFELEPGAVIPVTISLRLPRDVEPGRYEGLLRAELAAQGEGALVGAAAAARLSFEVAPSSGLEAFVREMVGTLTGLPVWAYAGLAMAAVAGVIWLASRRYSLRLERRA